MTKKFRIWDKLAKTFIFPDKGYQGHYVLDLNGRFHNLQNGSGGDEYVVQQWTGLLDKNSCEIYEGDICKWKWASGEGEVEQSTGEVFFENGIFYFGREYFCTADVNFDERSLEVIGSIFDNLLDNGPTKD